ncbi:RHS repeat-associated core domain-containing protein [Pseudomonas syringae group genomosp. 3]|uniref:YD repeat-containing protein n=1 Tax=Pseudomonas syringae pv. viburni TaxID=251703 RepID=A0A0Q0DQL0_9PSED|nr:RHS repeat-associated core domain-containing protein [Pseudomonas syringae group genomosp. 3]KPZ27186.1 YD repeat-containing protein [Pseudomonas syringae pv. viburni]
MDDTPEARRVLCRYRYDALDRVAVVDIEAQEAVSRFYQKSRLTVEIQGAVRRRVFHADDRLLAEYEADGAGDRVDLLVTDLQSSVLQAVGSQGRQPLAYSPYGHRAQGGPFSGFNGERADPVTGHYLLGNGYRAFNPVLMRFNSPDSLSPFGRGGLNAYAYCQGDPVNRSDPGGHISSFRVPGLTMFPKKSPFQRLPNEVLAKIIANLSLKSAENLAGTSRSMRGKVFGLIKQAWINVDDPHELLTIRNILSNKTDLPPAALKNVTFKAQFERAAANIEAGISEKIQNVDRRTQSILDEMARVPGASELHAKRALERAQRFQAVAPGKLAQITRQMAEYRQLRNDWGALINRGADTGWQIAEIRTSLNSR